MNEGSFILRWARPRLCHLKLLSFLFYPARRIECKHLIDNNAHITTSFLDYSAAMAGSLTLSRRTVARLLAAAPMAVAARRAVAQSTVWSMPTEYPATTVSGEGIVFFADRLAKESSGRLAIAPAYD